MNASSLAPYTLLPIMKKSKIQSIDELADELCVPKSVLLKYIFASNSFYREFRLAKKGRRGQRKIAAPSLQLKGIQRYILQHALRNVAVSDVSTAFRPDCTIIKNAGFHLGRDFVYSVDIKNFFPSISSRRVYGLFYSLGFTSEIASAFSRLTTYKSRLPQGAPTSPDIANLICRQLDSRLLGFARKNRWAYSRYSDDICISGDGHMSDTSARFIEAIINSEGFSLNPSKTRLRRQGSRQVVTGLVVNGRGTRPRVPRYKVRALRAILHQVTLNPQLYVNRLDEIQGMIAFLRLVNPNLSLLEENGKADAAIRSIRKVRSSMVS